MLFQSFGDYGSWSVCLIVLNFFIPYYFIVCMCAHMEVSGQLRELVQSYPMGPGGWTQVVRLDGKGLSLPTESGLVACRFWRDNECLKDIVWWGKTAYPMGAKEQKEEEDTRLSQLLLRTYPNILTTPHPLLYSHSSVSQQRVSDWAPCLWYRGFERDIPGPHDSKVLLYF